MGREGGKFLTGILRGMRRENTFTGRKDRTVIDYVLGSAEVKDRMISMRIGDKVNSNHQLVKIILREGWRDRGRGGEERKCGEASRIGRNMKDYRRRRREKPMREEKDGGK